MSETPALRQVRLLKSNQVAPAGTVGTVVRDLRLSGVLVADFNGRHMLVKLGQDVEVVNE